MPSPSKYTVANVNKVLDSINEPTISDKDLRIKISEVTGLIHPLALKQFIKAMEDLDYIIKAGNLIRIRDRRDGTNGNEPGVY